MTQLSLLKSTGDKPKVLSLFSGIGGLDLGFENQGFDVVAMLEWNHDCCETLRLNQGKHFSQETKIVEADINDVEPEDLFDGEIDFFIGGPPCQTFSAIGRRAGGAPGRLDARGDLFLQYCRLLSHYKPRGFMFENVRGILSSNKGRDWIAIQSEFASLGYTLSFRVLDAAGYGVAQHRERVILVGRRDGHEFKFPRPIYGPDSKSGVSFRTPEEVLKQVTVREDLQTLYQKGGKYDHLLAQIPPGGNYLHLTAEMGHPNPQFAWRSKFSDFLYKADPKTPVKTIVASMGRYSGPFHWDSRKLSIEELKTLQGFPEDYLLCGGRTSQIRQIGNSVVPLFANYLARAVRMQLFEDAPAAIELLEPDVKLANDSRKGVKAANTRQNRRSAHDASLLSLFDEPISHSFITLGSPSEPEALGFSIPSSSNSLPDEKVATSCSASYFVSDGDIVCELNRVSEEGKAAEMQLSFDAGVLKGIKSLRITLNNADAGGPLVIWECANALIRKFSSYPSVHEIYGHFTEPKPKFEIDFLRIPAKPSVAWLVAEWMSRPGNTVGNFKLLKMHELVDIREERKLIETLRAQRIDIRTNLTNSRIPSGYFRICYPYTLPVDRKSFVRMA